MNKVDIINEIKPFLDGYNEDLKYLVDVQVDNSTNQAECVIHPPGEPKRIEKIKFEPFMYMKDLKKHGYKLYGGNRLLQKTNMDLFGIKVKKLETGNQKRLVDGYCFKITSSVSFNAITNFLKKGGIDPYGKKIDTNGRWIKDHNGRFMYKNRDLFFNVRPAEQFLINKKARLFKGYEEYRDVHKVTFDIETTGLRPEISRVFAIGVKDNKGPEYILEVDKIDDDESEIKLIKEFIELYVKISPAVICGFHSEEFDFHYILKRLEILGFDVSTIRTTLKSGINLKRKPNSSVKLGNAAEKYTATEIWGLSVIDILHAAKKTAAVNTDIKRVNLKYLAKFEEVARDNRTYIPGEDNDIGRYYHENPYFVANDKNVFFEIPKEYQHIGGKLYELQQYKKDLTAQDYKETRNNILKENSQFVKWFKENALPDNMNRFVTGKELVKLYLSDDLYETEQIDELYNQSSFMLAKIVPTTFQRVCTMGTAGIWNLLLTAWSYDRDLAIPHSDVKKKFSGGLARTYKIGFYKRLVKIDYASLYPMEQLTWDIFPFFDITGVMRKMLIYLTTARNIYKKLAKSIPLNEEEVLLMESIDPENYNKYIKGTLTDKDRNMFGVKQLPVKILNNSQFGALGADVAFNWSDNMCAARITCCGRLDLRQGTAWFKKYGCVPLLAVTDGINFHIPDNTKIRVTDEGVTMETTEGTIEEMWKYGGEVGIAALIEKYNVEVMVSPNMSVDNDGEFLAGVNLARINYALLQEYKDKKSGEIKTKVKLTGNTIKSKALAEYIEEFVGKGLRMILENKPVDFVKYYNEYVQQIFDMEIPLKKIANKRRYKNNIKQYLNRGNDKNGKPLAKQAHMELILHQREKIAEELFQEHKANLDIKSEENLTIQDKLNMIEVYMPPEPELDSTIYYYNTGYRASHGDSDQVKDIESKELRPVAILIDKNTLVDNPELIGVYNIDKYLKAFNKRVSKIMVAFDPEIRKQMLAKIVRTKEKDKEGNKFEVTRLERCKLTRDQLELKAYDLDDYDESMHLEEKEIEFWSEYGYDPRLVWDGFKMNEDNKIHYDVYEHALKFVSDKMIEAGKPPVKSVNDKIEKGDYILIKNQLIYSLGYHNGNYIQIVKETVDVPKTEYELELEAKLMAQKEQEEKVERELYEKELGDHRKKYYIKFRKSVLSKIPTLSEISFTDFSELGDEYMQMLDDFIKTSQQPKYSEYDIDSL